MSHIFFIGAFLSGIGKGIFASSIASILNDFHLHLNIIKLDPYLNVDAGVNSCINAYMAIRQNLVVLAHPFCRINPKYHLPPKI